MAQLSISSLASDFASIEVEVGMPETLTVTYRKNAITVGDSLHFSELSETPNAAAARESIAFYADKVITGWGLIGPFTDADGKSYAAGKTIPVTMATLTAIPSDVYAAIMAAIAGSDPNASRPTA